ncbi:hypothetical protein LSM04_008974 [Trypanosoma melophagium]|uniref:uncharacterized protein n=1 Tax=Trypanosoma melophagium TaxID=715481 RepID=UPI003519FAB3|nr:hypothetical protein LSM04_008974 [Trypanosoma melophagium]
MTSLSVRHKLSAVAAKGRPTRTETNSTSTNITAATHTTINNTNNNTNNTVNTAVHKTGCSHTGTGRTKPIIRRSVVSTRRKSHITAKNAPRNETTERPAVNSIRKESQQQQEKENEKEKDKQQQEKENEKEKDKQQQYPETRVHEDPLFMNGSVPNTQTFESESSVDAVETSDFLTRLALEDCVACLENLQNIISSFTSQNGDGDKRTKDGNVLVERVDVNPFKLSKRPIVQIAEELSSRLNQLTDRCEAYLKKDSISATKCDEDKKGNERNTAQVTEDTFGRAVETQYTITTTLNVEKKEGKGTGE